MIVQSIHEPLHDSLAGEPDARLRDLRTNLEEYGAGFKIPPDSGAKTALARLISRLFEGTEEPIIYIGEWGVWPSSENPEIFDSYRQAKGEGRSLREAPVHIFNSSSEASFVGILCLALYFVWDVAVFDRAKTSLVYISHDEWLEIRTVSAEARQICDEAVKRNFLKPLR